MEHTYREFTISHNPKPIPSRKHDWDWCHNDYDGPGDNRCGTSGSVRDAYQRIDDLISDAEFDQKVMDEENGVKRCGDCGVVAEKLVNGVGLCCWMG